MNQALNVMDLHLLYPCSPLRRSEPDELYAEEHAVALEMGFDASLFPFDEFLDGGIRVRPALQPGQAVLYRGWMVNPQQYARLYSKILTHGATLLTSPERYERCHHLPTWYPQLREFTPETCFFQESDDVAARLRESSWNGCFLKDYVKSLAIEGGSMVHNLDKIPAVIAKMKAYRGAIEGGLCARRIEDFMPETEERYFVLKSRPFSRCGSVPDVVKTAAERIDSPFFTVDTVQRRDGITRIIELGDGQVSDRKKWTAQQLLSILRNL
jgi:hypothetical protein